MNFHIFVKFLKTIFINNEKYFHNSDFSIENLICQHFPWIFKKYFNKVKIYARFFVENSSALTFSKMKIIFIFSKISFQNPFNFHFCEFTNLTQFFENYFHFAMLR